MNQGAEALSSAELIAIILGSGTKGKSVLALASELISSFGSLNNLVEASIEELCRVKGLGQAKAIQLKAALSLAFRAYQEKRPLREPVTSPMKAYLWVRDFLVHRKKEVFGVILMDARGAAYRFEEIAVGTLTQTLVHPREVFHPAIVHLAASIILVHNHPSGDPTPSSEDYHLTRQLVTASHSVMIPIKDHLIVTQEEYLSFRETGFFFEKEAHCA
ncbi:MAG: hypothetical protein S4CHLAM123_10510 [Chlamydiales bacterium]|nr:hypothetical protein [Chlamydiales bacterium]